MRFVFPFPLLFILFLIVSCCSTPFQPMTEDPTELDTFILSRMEASHKPGLSAAAFNSQKILWKGQYGARDLENARPVEEETPFLVGSVSKLFVGAAVMQLVEQGRVDLEADVQEYVDFPVRNPDFPDDPITIRMLMTHSAGISMNFFKIWFSRVKGDYQGDYGDFCREYLVPGGRYYSGGSYDDFAPGEGFVYSNVSITLLAHVIEKLTGMRLEEYSRKHIFDPLKLDATSWLYSSYPEGTVAYPYGHGLFGFSNTGYFSFPIHPAGFMKSSSSDLARFFMCVFQGGELEGRRILSETSVARMLELQPGIQPDNWDRSGLIWQYKELEGGYRLWGHSGGLMGGIAALAFYDPQRDRGVVLLMNGEWQCNGSYDRFEDEAIREIFTRLMSEDTVGKEKEEKEDGSDG